MERCTGVVKFYNAAQNLGGIERETNDIYKEPPSSPPQTSRKASTISAQGKK